MPWQQNISIFRLAIFLVVLIALITDESTAEQKYHQEVFLRFPGKISHDGRFITGPKGIGVNHKDQLCIFEGIKIAVYDDSGVRIREIILQDEDGNYYGGSDFCFDKEGNIFTTRNVSGEVFINKFEPGGYLVERMENDARLVTTQERRQIFLGGNIAYFPGYGLVLYQDMKEHVPITFKNGKVPDMTMRQKVKDWFIISKDKFLTYDLTNMESPILTIQMGKGESETITVPGYRYVVCNSIYSADPEHQYFYIATRDRRTNDRIREIRKYEGHELVFSTGQLPINKVETSRGKKHVVDSKGTIYYYWGDENEIQIIRWVLK